MYILCNQNTNVNQIEKLFITPGDGGMLLTVQLVLLHFIIAG